MEKNQETGLTCRVGKPMLWTELRAFAEALIPISSDASVFGDRPLKR